jgi:Ti-type conjugative transfer relaxase TraA
VAIFHLHMATVSRATGRSAVAAAAYRAGVTLTNNRDGLTHDYQNRRGIEHAEIFLPGGIDTAWARDRSALWNAAEKAEKRSDGRVAREVEVALPCELTALERLAAVRDLAQELADTFGVAVDAAIHAPLGASDVRNHHAHLLMTTRRISADGIGDKSSIERENKWLLAHNLPTAAMQLKGIRQVWEAICNRHLMAAGQDIRVDSRSHLDRGVEILPTMHVGVQATKLARSGLSMDRVRLAVEAAALNAELIRTQPEHVLTLIAAEKSVFDRHDVARALHREIDDPEDFSAAFAAVMASPAVVELRPEVRRGDEVIALARYATRATIAVEAGMVAHADALMASRVHGVNSAKVSSAIVAEGERLGGAGLGVQQQAAVAHVTGPEGIALVVGVAGAGKSTAMTAARLAWEADGYQVHGAALSGKAASGLQASSGIASRTLASWEHGFKTGKDVFGPRDVLVIDEAGMVASATFAAFVERVARAGAKLVLVGDHEQLQAIGAGAPFRALAERLGYAELTDIRRQKEAWQRAASSEFARTNTAIGLASYAANGAIKFETTRDHARLAIVAAFVAAMTERPSGSRVAMAYLRADVAALNAEIREALQAHGASSNGPAGGEITFETINGPRAFAAGDRLVFLENARDLAGGAASVRGVLKGDTSIKNGMLGTVLVADRAAITVRLDVEGQDAKSGRVVCIPTDRYQAFDHGYATTIHKTQGATVERAFVLASDRMDRHLTYVALTRRTEAVTLYAEHDEFTGLASLSVKLGRNGSKETTLDYTQVARAQPPVQSKPSSKVTLANFRIPKLSHATPRAAIAAVSPLEAALERLAVTGDNIRMVMSHQLPVGPNTHAAYEQAQAEPEKIMPGSVAVLRSALAHDAAARAAVMSAAGPAWRCALEAAVQREQAAVLNPVVRASRLIGRFEAAINTLAAAEKTYDSKIIATAKDAAKVVIADLARDEPAQRAMPGAATALKIDPKSVIGQALRAPNVVAALKQTIDPPAISHGYGFSR